MIAGLRLESRGSIENRGASGGCHPRLVRLVFHLFPARSPDCKSALARGRFDSGGALSEGGVHRKESTEAIPKTGLIRQSLCRSMARRAQRTAARRPARPTKPRRRTKIGGGKSQSRSARQLPELSAKWRGNRKVSWRRTYFSDEQFLFVCCWGRISS